MKKLFGQIKFSWFKVLTFAVITGLYTGLVMCIPKFEGTSIQDIGISYEWWVIFAVIVVVNCKKWWDAAFKCFIFFLISQPLIYGVEVLANKITLDMAIYYYQSIWLPATFLTLPGGAIAYFCKKQNILGAIILGFGNSIQLFMGIYYLKQAIVNFPFHILSAILALCSVFVFTYFIQRKNLNRIICIVVPIIILGLFWVFTSTTGRTFI